MTTFDYGVPNFMYCLLGEAMLLHYLGNMELVGLSKHY